MPQKKITEALGAAKAWKTKHPEQTASLKALETAITALEKKAAAVQDAKDKVKAAKLAADEGRDTLTEALKAAKAARKAPVAEAPAQKVPVKKAPAKKAPAKKVPATASVTNRE